MEHGNMVENEQEQESQRQASLPPFTSFHFFDAFAIMINDLPEEAVIKALDLEGKTLENELEFSPLMFPDDAFSILHFTQFVRMVKDGEAMESVKPIPPEHVEFYKKTIGRLIHATKLPPFAMEQFDYIFHSIPVSRRTKARPAKSV
jgi:hypothetical protein